MRKQVPPGRGTWLSTRGVGSVPSSASGSPGPVAQSIAWLIPGTWTRSWLRGGGPSLTTTARPPAPRPVTTRRTCMECSLEQPLTSHFG